MIIDDYDLDKPGHEIMSLIEKQVKPGCLLRCINEDGVTINKRDEQLNIIGAVNFPYGSILHVIDISRSKISKLADVESHFHIRASYGGNVINICLFYAKLIDFAVVGYGKLS